MADARIRLALDGVQSVIGGLTRVGERISSVAGSISALTAIGGTLSAAAFAGWVKGAIDAADAAGKLSQKTGVAIQDVAGLELAYELAGLGGDALTSSMSKLSKGMVDGSKTLDALGIKSKNLDGTFRSTKDVMYTVADSFQGMDDGAQKTALALELFGKSGADMIPLLNGGSEGLREMDDMARKLGLTISEDTKNSAEQFNDTLDLLGKGSQGVARGIAAELLPTLSSLGGSFLESMTSGDKLKKTAQFLATGLKLLYTVGVGIVEVFSTVGKTIGAAGGQIVAILSGDFKLAHQIGLQWSADIGSSWAATAKSISDAWDTSGNSAVDSMTKIGKTSTTLHADAAEVAKQTAAANKELENQSKLLSELAGLTGTFAKDWQLLSVAYASGKLSVDGLIKAQADLLAKQPAIKASNDAIAKASEESIKRFGQHTEALDKFYKAQSEAVAKSIADATQEADQNELLARTFGMTKSAIEQMELARLEEQLAHRSSVGMTWDEIEALKALIEQKKRNTAATGQLEELETTKKANDDMLADWKKSVEQYDDVFRKGFAGMVNGGKGSWKAFTTSLVTTFKTSVADQIYKMFAQPFVVKMVASLLGVTGGGAAGIAQAAGSMAGDGGGSGSMLSLASSIKSTYSAITTGFSGLSASVTGYTQAAINSINGTNYAMAASQNGGFAAGAGTAAGYAAGAAVGVYGGRMISGGYSAIGGGSGNTAVNVGTAIGAIWGPIGAAIGGMLGGLVNRAFGMKQKEVTSRGIEGNFANSGFAGNAFSTWHQDGGWFRSDKNGRNTSALDSATSNQLGSGFASLQMASASAAAALGLSADAIANYSERISITLTGDRARDTDALTALFSGIGDRMAAAAAPGIASLAKQGETASATLARLSGSITTANAWLSMLRQRLFQVSLAGGDAASKLADAFGGLESLTNASKTFYEMYYTEGERAARSQQDMTDALELCNLALPASKAELRAMAGALDLNTDAGRAAYATLLALAPEFSATSSMIEKLAKDAAVNLIATFTGGGKLVPALDAASLGAKAFASALGETAVRSGTISAIFLDAGSGLITFGVGVSDLGAGLTGAQQAGQQLADQIADLRLGAADAALDMAGLTTALANVNTETFVATIGLVFENLAGRIKGVIGEIGSERIALREAAMQIINPTVMSKAAIQTQMGAINTSLPSNTAILGANAAMGAASAQQAALDKVKAGIVSTYTPVMDSQGALADATRQASQASLTAFKAILDGGVNKIWNGRITSGIAKGSDYKTTAENFDDGTKFKATGYSSYGTTTAKNNAAYATYSTQFDAAYAAQSVYAKSAAEYTAKMGNVAAQQLAITAAAESAANMAKNAQLAYASALQDFTIDASKSVGKLSKLREETVKYYDAQKQLADLMGKSADSLRGTVASYRYSQLTDSQQLDKLQSDYAGAYAMGLSTTGETLAGYGDKLNSMLNSLLEKAREVMSGSAYSTFEQTTLARAEAIAGRLEDLTPTDYAADSLAMLGQIDATLAALDASASSAEKIIADAINAGSDRTAAGLHAVIAALTGQSVPAFATGAAFTNGIVSRPTAFNIGEMGEAGSEAIMPLTNINGSLGVRAVGGGNNTARLEDLVERLTQEVINLRAEARATATNTGKTARQLDRLAPDGDALQMREVPA